MKRLPPPKREPGLQELYKLLRQLILVSGDRAWVADVLKDMIRIYRSTHQAEARKEKKKKRGRGGKVERKRRR